MPAAKKAEAPPQSPAAEEAKAVVEPKPAKKAEPVARSGGWVDYGDGHGWVPEKE